MTYGVLYIDEGNFLNWYARRQDAEQTVLEVAQQDRRQGQSVRRIRLRRRPARQARRSCLAFATT